MGVDLTLLPLLAKDYWVSHDVIQTERRRELWDPIMQLPAKPIPYPLVCYLARSEEGEPCYGKRSDDPYGGALSYTTAGDLYSLREHEGVRDNEKNRAVWAWLGEMPRNWPIVLYWH